MEKKNEYLVDDTPMDLSDIEKLSDEDFLDLLSDMEGRHEKIKNKNIKSEE